MKPFIVTDSDGIQLTEGLKALPVWSELSSLKYNKQTGDSDGRKRYRIAKETQYLYHKLSWESVYQGKSEGEREEAVRLLLDLDDKWKMSDELQEMEKHIIEAQETNTAWRSLKVARKLLHKLEKQIDETEDIETMTKYLKDLPKLNETINLLQKQFDESKKSVVAVGQHEIGEWEKD